MGEQYVSRRGKKVGERGDEKGEGWQRQRGGLATHSPCSPLGRAPPEHLLCVARL